MLLQSTCHTLRMYAARNSCILQNVTTQSRRFSQLTKLKSAAHSFRNKTLDLKQILKRNSSNIAEGLAPQTQKIVGGWLVGCAGMCFGAVVLGGLTRLTESGLSMVDWKLIKDMTPPKNQLEWIAEFEKYKTYPEYAHIISSGREMTLSDFKFIFYMEWGHRLWGRATGTVFLLPAAFFLYKGWITKAMKPRLAIYTALIGFQGFMGWYMVKSGLEEKTGVNDVPRVSQYRLAAHLSTAVILYSLFLWSGMSHLTSPVVASAKKITNLRTLQKFSHGVTGLVFLTLVSGAFVAGLDAGLTYNTWPKMADRWIPTDLLSYKPKWSNFFENPTTVQFDHRILGKLTVLSAVGLWAMCLRAPLPPQAKLAAHCVMAMSLIQMTLGITTLLTQVHTHVAATHQAGAVTLLSFSLWLMHILKRIPK